MNRSNKINLILLITYSILLLAQIWFTIFNSNLFIKISLTYLIILIVNLILSYFYDYKNDENKLKKDKYID